MEPPKKVDDQSPCDVIQTKGAVSKDLPMMKSEQASLQKEMCNKTALVSGIGVNSVDYGPWTPNVEARNKTAPVSGVGVNSVDFGPWTPNVEAQKMTERRWKEAEMSLAFTPATQEQNKVQLNKMRNVDKEDLASHADTKGNFKVSPPVKGGKQVKDGLQSWSKDLQCHEDDLSSLESQSVDDRDDSDKHSEEDRRRKKKKNQPLLSEDKPVTIECKKDKLRQNISKVSCLGSDDGTRMAVGQCATKTLIVVEDLYQDDSEMPALHDSSNSSRSDDEEEEVVVNVMPVLIGAPSLSGHTGKWYLDIGAQRNFYSPGLGAVMRPVGGKIDGNRLPTGEEGAYDCTNFSYDNFKEPRPKFCKLLVCGSDTDQDDGELVPDAVNNSEKSDTSDGKEDSDHGGVEEQDDPHPQESIEEKEKAIPIPVKECIPDGQIGNKAGCEVEEILEDRSTKRKVRNRTEYLLKWKSDWPDEWISAQTLNTRELVK